MVLETFDLAVKKSEEVVCMRARVDGCSIYIIIIVIVAVFFYERKKSNNLRESFMYNTAKHPHYLETK